ncbi:MarR family transcriptional regulator [Flavonifractor sp. AGMB03687]|uniref:MarR family winged helix-turn-helix transcriptional regulator n=1 Tax=Flavonifractor sp. AGMB03687 TaxID=2785133 RepID=UPI001AE01CAE|nr:MarR family transcriptional regulator [Flavonifractor sp. AGMB03687]
MDSFYGEIETRFVRIFNTYAEMQRNRHEYCPGVALTPLEIHAIERIAITNPINITELSLALDMTKGGVSKCVDRLEKLGLVRRYKYMRNQKEVYLHLTEQGVDAFHGHERYHRVADQVIIDYGKQLSPETQDEILGFLDMYLKQMNILLNQPNETTSNEKGE